MSFAHIRCLVLLAGMLALPAAAQLQVTGSFSGTTAQAELVQFTFSCEGSSPCEGNWRMLSQIASCPNQLQRSGNVEIAGLNLTNAGPVSGTINLKGGNHGTPAGCVYALMPVGDLVLPFTGTWDGNRGTLAMNVTYQGAPFTFLGSFTASVPVFGLEVSGSTGPGVANVTAEIQFRPQDVGTTGSIYVFAIAPVDVVRPAQLRDAPPPLGKAAALGAGSADAPVACVLAQINASGQLQQVSASSMQAFVTGVLGAQGASVSVLNGVASVNIGGATFYVGYGASAQAMLSAGITRYAIAAPGARECRPGPPQAGWWWNPNEGGRGYSIEAQGNHIFYAAFLYDDAGRSNWYVATGTTAIDGSLFTGDLLAVSNGQTLGGAYRAPGAARSAGPFTLAFDSATTGTMVWAGGTVAIERFDIVPNGRTAAKRVNQPETGWWWNPAESGRGFFIEWQDGTADLAGYMYDDAGNPVWYLTVVNTPDMRALSSSWWLYGGGQSLTGAYKPATRINDNVAPVTITFTSATTATMTLPNGRTTALQRHRF